MKSTKRIKVFPFAIFQSVLTGFLGLLCGVLYSFGGLIIDTLVSIGLLSAETMSTPGLSIGTVYAFGALIGMPIIFVVIGFFAGIVEAFLYNFLAQWFGGFKIDFQELE